MKHNGLVGKQKESLFLLISCLAYSVTLKFKVMCFSEMLVNL
jgi:hypothetical protein